MTASRPGGSKGKGGHVAAGRPAGDVGASIRETTDASAYTSSQHEFRSQKERVNTRSRGGKEKKRERGWERQKQRARQVERARAHATSSGVGRGLTWKEGATEGGGQEGQEGVSRSCEVESDSGDWPSASRRFQIWDSLRGPFIKLRGAPRLGSVRARPPRIARPLHPGPWCATKHTATATSQRDTQPNLLDICIYSLYIHNTRVTHGRANVRWPCVVRTTESRSIIHPREYRTVRARGNNTYIYTETDKFAYTCISERGRTEKHACIHSAHTHTHLYIYLNVHKPHICVKVFTLVSVAPQYYRLFEVSARAKKLLEGVRERVEETTRQGFRARCKSAPYKNPRIFKH